MSSTPLPVVDLGRHLAVSLCPYARHGVVTHGLTLTEISELPCAARLLQQYARDTALHGSSMFAVQVDPKATPDGVHSLASLFRYLVHYANSTRTAREKLYADILSPSWRLTIEGATFFAIALSPIYPAAHHRYTEPMSLFLFQPENLFTSFGITNSPARPALSQAVAKRFALAGRPYASAHLRGVPKSLRTILTVEANAIAWWTSPFPAIGRHTLGM
jgi:hypothetical protein